MATPASQLSFLETNTGNVNVPSNLYVSGTIYQGGVAIGTGGGSGTVASGTGTTTTFVIQNYTQSTSTNSGALVVWGGAGFGGNVYQGGVHVIFSTATSTSTTTGALIVTGGAGIGGNLNVGGNIVGGGVRATSSANPPTIATVGDIWYNTSNDVVLRYTLDGAGNNYWVDITSPTVGNSSTVTTPDVLNPFLFIR